jgi:hypothetical protein
MLMRTRLLWLIAVSFSLLSAPAWAHSSQDRAAGGKQKDERRDSSIRLTTTKRAELSVLSQRLGEGHLSKSLSKNGRGDDGDDEKASKSHASVRGLPPGLAKKIGEIRLNGKNGKNGRGDRDDRTPIATLTASATPAGAVAAPIPEPSSLLFFGVGLVVARRAISRKWR